MTGTSSSIHLYLPEPRGFCAGVRRAIAIVEQALQQYGAPVYVRHEIVHNKHVIQSLKAKGAVFVEDLSAVPEGSVTIFSAHGVGQNVIAEAHTRHLQIIDATCPLVEKVHQQIIKYAAAQMSIIVIGKSSHPEIIGTIGQIQGYQDLHIINSLHDAETISVKHKDNIGFVTQTTLSVDDTQAIVDVLKSRFPNIHGLQKKDICYATTNRQKAIKAIAAQSECVLILGSQNSSNSKQLRDTALKNGAKLAFLIDDASEISWDALQGIQHIGISAGASAPEYLVDELIKTFQQRYDKINIHHVTVVKENVNFKI